MYNTHYTQAQTNSQARAMRYSDYLVLARRCQVQRKAMIEAIQGPDSDSDHGYAMYDDLAHRAIGFAFGLELINHRLYNRYNQGAKRFTKCLNQLISRYAVIRFPYGSI